MRREELLSKDVEDALVEEDLLVHDDWFEARKQRIASGSKPGLEVCSVTTWKGGPQSREIEVVELPRADQRPSGRRLGTLVHEVLARVPLEAEPGLARATAVLRGRVLGAMSEVETAGQVVSEALQCSLFALARAALEVRRETPVAFLDDDGVLVEGVVDLAFRDPSGWTVADFKTDQDFEGNLPDHRRQLTAYVQAIGKATGLPARGVLLRL